MLHVLGSSAATGAGTGRKREPWPVIRLQGDATGVKQCHFMHQLALNKAVHHRALSEPPSETRLCDN
eukprot:scaffold247534_cov21-Tisochrysis_lutea.AAC.3